jgi:hypothetical protein
MLTTLTPRDLFAVRKSPSKLARARLRGTRVMTIQVQWLPAQCVSLFAFFSLSWCPGVLLHACLGELLGVLVFFSMRVLVNFSMRVLVNFGELLQERPNAASRAPRIQPESTAKNQ